MRTSINIGECITENLLRCAQQVQSPSLLRTETIRTKTFGKQHEGNNERRQKQLYIAQPIPNPTEILRHLKDTLLLKIFYIVSNRPDLNLRSQFQNSSSRR